MAEFWYKDIKTTPSAQLRTLPVSEQLARCIREHRKQLRLTQKELAKIVGTTQAAIGRLETARGNPTVDLVRRVADALGFELFINWQPRNVSSARP